MHLHANFESKSRSWQMKCNANISVFALAFELKATLGATIFVDSALVLHICYDTARVVKNNRKRNA